MKKIIFGLICVCLLLSGCSSDITTWVVDYKDCNGRTGSITCQSYKTPYIGQGSNIVCNGPVALNICTISYTKFYSGSITL